MVEGSETIILELLKLWYSPLPFKYLEREGIKDLSYSRVKGDSRLNDSKMAEIADRRSM